MAHSRKPEITSCEITSLSVFSWPVCVFQVDYSEMRISLNQKPNSSRDFGFQNDWDSTGVRVKSVVPGKRNC